MEIEEVKKYLQNIVDSYEPENTEDDFNPMDACGGNFDDAYSMGVEVGEYDGQYSLAWKLLKLINNG